MTNRSAQDTDILGMLKDILSPPTIPNFRTEYEAVFNDYNRSSLAKQIMADIQKTSEIYKKRLADNQDSKEVTMTQAEEMDDYFKKLLKSIFLGSSYYKEELRFFDALGNPYVVATNRDNEPGYSYKITIAGYKLFDMGKYGLQVRTSNGTCISIGDKRLNLNSLDDIVLLSAGNELSKEHREFKNATPLQIDKVLDALKELINSGHLTSTNVFKLDDKKIAKAEIVDELF